MELTDKDYDIRCLWQSVIMQAVLDATSTKASLEIERCAAIKFITRDEYFYEVAEMAGLNAEKLRYSLRKKLEKEQE